MPDEQTSQRDNISGGIFDRITARAGGKNIINAIAVHLQETALFQHVDLTDLIALAEVMEQQSFMAGEVLFWAGDQGDTMYIIRSGRIRIFTRDDQDDDLTLAHFGESEIFGEFSLLDSEPRSASAAAVEDTEVLILHRDDFMDFLLQRPLVALAMMRTLSQRARYTTTYLEEVMHWAKMLARGNYQYAIDELSDSSGDNEIQRLVSAFMEMAHSVRQREDDLKKEVVRLKVQIDQEKRQDEVQSITGSAFFSMLKERAQKMREDARHESDEE